MLSWTLAYFDNVYKWDSAKNYLLTHGCETFWLIASIRATWMLSKSIDWFLYEGSTDI